MLHAHFKLNLELYGEVEETTSNWNQQSAGTIRVKLTKVIKQNIWRHLTPEKRRYKIWYDIHNDAMETYIEQME